MDSQELFTDSVSEDRSDDLVSIGNETSLFQNFRKTVDLVPGTRYKVRYLRQVKTTFGFKIRAYLDDFNYDLPNNFLFSLNGYVLECIDYTNVYMHYVGRKNDRLKTLILNQDGMPKLLNEKKVIDLDKPLKPGAFVDPSKIKQYTEDDFILPETPPFSWLLRKTKEEQLGTSPKSDDEPQLNSGVSPSKTDTSINNNSNPLRGSEDMVAKSDSPPASLLDSKRSFRGGKNLPPEDERLLKHFPFATPNTPMNDLAKFYRDCFNAPPLQEFTQTPIEEEVTVDNLAKQLEQFETSLGDYDTLVTSICSQSVDNNSNS